MGGRAPLFMPSATQFEVPPQQRYQAPPRQAAPGQTTARNDRYLPAMPEMLQRPPSQPASQPLAARERQATVASRNEPVIRGQAPDEKETPSKQIPTLPVKLKIPSPEELGFVTDAKVDSRPAPAATAVIGWSTARQRLDQLGSTFYRLEKADGGYRFACALPGQQGKERQFEATKATENDAIKAVFEQIDGWHGGAK